MKSILLILKTSYIQVAVFFIALIVIIVLYYHFYPTSSFICLKNWIDFWSNHGLEFISTVITLLFVVFVWFNEKKEAWQNSLPKKLNIEYWFDNIKIATVNNAPLTGSDDIRQWGQSLARTLFNNGANIDFEGFEIIFPKEETKEKNVMEYNLKVYLSKKLTNPKDRSFEDNGKIKQLIE